MTDQARLEENLCWEIGLVQQNKHGNTVCGDQVVISREGDRVRLVLSDGLGSGIQACIASTLTSTLVSGLTGHGLSLEDCIRGIDAVLPVTKKHKLAYATFSLIATEGRQVRIIQYDSPAAVFLRDGVSLDYPFRPRTVLGKELQESLLTMKSGDMLVLFSDGVSEAGRGVTTYSGWDRRKMEDYLFRSVHPDDCARHVAANIISAVQALDLYEFHDDTSVAVLRLRERLPAHLLIGSSDAWEPDDSVLRSFFEREGLHLICGNGAVQAAARHLGTEVRVRRETVTEALPPVSEVDGVDLAVEEERTFPEALSAIERYCRDGMMSLDPGQPQDGASLLLELMAERASEVNILFCTAGGNSPVGGTAADRSSAAGTLPVREPLKAPSAAAERPEQLLRLRQLLTELGKTVTFSFC